MVCQCHHGACRARKVKKSIRSNSQIKASALTATAVNPAPSRSTKTLDLRQQNRGSTQRGQPQRPAYTISALPHLTKR